MLKQPSHEYRGFRAGGIRLGEEIAEAGRTLEDAIDRILG